MSLIKCTECGCEVSDKATACPNCGCPIEEIISDLNAIKEKRYDNVGGVSDRKDANMLVDTLPPNDVEYTKRSSKKTKIIVIIISILVVIVIGIICVVSVTKRDSAVLGRNSKSKDYTKMSEQEKIEVITQFLGTVVDVNNNSISMSQELVDFLNHAELFKYYGTCTSSYSSNNTQGEVILDIADWVSDDTFNEEMFDDIVKQLSDIYGETSIEEYVLDDIQGEYVWRNIDDFSFIICGKNADDKVDVRWIITNDLDDNVNDNKLTDTDSFKMYTEYEGKYESKAELYETDATECFLKDLESSKQSFADFMGEPDAVIEPEWNMSGSFEYNNNYYFCYKYSFYAGGSESHVLVKYDVKANEASIKTPLEWIDADIEAAKAKVNI